MAKYSVLGKSPIRMDAMDKAKGRAIYTADITLPNMLYGKVLRSPHAHARIKNLDITKAQTLPGVISVVTADDVPGLKTGKMVISPANYPCMAKDKVLYEGQPIAAVAATDLNIAEEAMQLIGIEYEVLTPVTDIMEAMKPDAPMLHPERQVNADFESKIEKESMPNNVALYKKFKRGDAEAGFKKADIVLGNTFRTQRVHQGYLEPRVSIASVGPEGKVIIWTDNQGMFMVRELCSDFLDLPLSKIKVMPVEIGGAMGGKNLQPLAPLCALLSIKTGRPVKMLMTKAEDFLDNRPAPASIITIKLGADKEGHLIAAEATFIFDNGAFTGEMLMSPGASISGLSPYLIPNLNVDCFDIFTNTTPSGFYRAPQAPQAAFAVESQMDLLARALNIDPLELRIKNAVSEGDPMSDGATLPRIGFKETLGKMKLYLSTHKEPEGENKGRGIACGFWRGGSSFSAANVYLNTDGSVTAVLGSMDISGNCTSLAQIAAEEFGIRYEDVNVVTGDTDTAPYSGTTSGSKTTHQMGMAVSIACRDAKTQIIQQAALQLRRIPDDLEYTNGRVQLVGKPDTFLSLADIGRGTLSMKGIGPITGRGSVGMPEIVPMFAVHTADVVVDKETGKVKLLSYVAAQDVGFAVNPCLVEGQMQGAVSQCVGWALMEEYALHDGVMQNPNLLDYRMPTSLDLPFIDTLIVEVNSTTRPYGLRGVAEPPMVPSLATIANAIHSAAGVRLKKLPMTPEAILKALKNQK